MMNDPDIHFDESQASSIESLKHAAAACGVPFLAEVPPEFLDPVLVANLPVEWARTHVLLPVRTAEGLGVLTTDPLAVDEHHSLAMVVGEDLVPVVTTAECILRCIEQCYYHKEDSPTDFLKDLSSRQKSPAITSGSKAEDLLQESSEKAPVTHLVNLILLEAVRRRASDIHFEPFDDRLRVRYRVDGVLYEQDSPPKHLEDALVSRLKVMAHMDIAERRLPQDGMARVRVGEREIDIRVSTVPVAEGERVVLRLLDRETALLPLTALGMSEQMLGDFRELLAEPNGMVVVSGPTGSGKTTTLYAALSELDAHHRNILTIEEPIEYRLPDIGQIQVKPKIGLTFASGLRHILRQDPDIVLVGETRDLETADIALRASLTGHLVFTTLHTNDAVGTVLRLVDMGVEPFLLASCLRGVLAQRLVRRLCPGCRCKADRPELPDDLPVALARLIEGQTLYEPAGCGECLEGFRGRVGLFELLMLTDELAAMVREGASRVDALRAAAVEGGMCVMAEDAAGKLTAGTTSLREVVAVLR